MFFFYYTRIPSGGEAQTFWVGWQEKPCWHITEDWIIMHSVTVQYREQMHKYCFNPFLGFSPSDTQLPRKVLMFLVHCLVIVICHLFLCLLHHFILVSPEILRDIFGIFIKLLFPARFSYEILQVWTKLGYTAQVWIDGPSVGDFCVVAFFFFPSDHRIFSFTWLLPHVVHLCYLFSGCLEALWSENRHA